MTYLGVWNQWDRTGEWQLLVTLREGDPEPSVGGMVDVGVNEFGELIVYEQCRVKSTVWADQVTGLPRFYVHLPPGVSGPPKGIRSSGGPRVANTPYRQVQPRHQVVTEFKPKPLPTVREVGEACGWL